MEVEVEVEVEVDRYLGDSATDLLTNTTNITRPLSPDLHVLKLTDKMVVVVAVLAPLALLTAAVNLAVMAAICTTKKLRLPANYLICSLAFTDFLVAVLVMPLSVLYVATETWSLGRAACAAWLSVDVTCCTCSILHLCVIALDRYWAITKAVEYARRKSGHRAAATIAAVWLISALISLPPLFWRRWAGDRRSKVGRCVIEHDHVGYTIYSTLGAFYIPMVLLLVLYRRIYRAAKTLYQKRSSSRHRGSRREGSRLPADGRRSAPSSDPAPSVETQSVGACGPEERGQTSSRERKAARILGLILGAFILCWFPFFLKELLVGLQLLHPSPCVSDVLTWLGYINSLINPLLYTSFNDDFKLAFKNLFKRKEHA